MDLIGVASILYVLAYLVRDVLWPRLISLTAACAA